MAGTATAAMAATARAAARTSPVSQSAGDSWAGQPQPQAPPQHPPPPPPVAGLAADGDAVPPTDTAESSFTVSSWPCGHGHGADASLIGRLRSNVSPQVRHRYS